MSDNIIQLNEDLIKNNLKDLVRNSVEETLNALLDHEADELVNADKYERSGARKGYCSGHYERNFSTTSGDVTLKVPKLKRIQFETAIIERYKRRECSVEEALIEIIWPGSRYAVLRTSLKHSGEVRCPRGPSATSIRKPMNTSKNGVPARLQKITLTSMSMAFTLSAAGVEKSRMSLFS